MRACVVLACTSAFMRPSVNACMRACVCACVCTCVYRSVYMYICVWRLEYDYMVLTINGYYTTIRWKQTMFSRLIEVVFSLKI